VNEQLGSMDPAGAQAGHIRDLFWGYLGISGLVFCLVMVALAIAVWRARGVSLDGEPGASIEPAARRRLTLAVGTATGFSVVILLVLLVASVGTGRALSSLLPTEGPERTFTIELVGHQWWWEIHYLGPQPAFQVTTANEIHVPVGRKVVLRLRAADVIHSFWVPQLQGKRDLIPGYVTELPLIADKPGLYRGQCAEFCGQQHALMALSVIAEPPAKFQRWLRSQREPAAAVPGSALERRGQQVFLASSCPLCHGVQGTAAGAGNGPDLTHLMSRRTLGSGTLPNTPQYLKEWIVDPQRFKPGNAMPPSMLEPDDLAALLGYLESLR
jgi:cytochrome c oxidase subunit 2